MLRSTLLALITAAVAFGQCPQSIVDAGVCPQGVVDGQLSIESPSTTVRLYGHGAKRISTGTIHLTNDTNVTVKIPPEMIYVALPTIPSMNPADATALLTKAYGHQWGQVVTQVVQAGALSIGAAMGAGGLLNISAKVAGYLLGGVGLFDKFITPLFTLNQPALPDLLANTLDGQGVIMMAPGDGVSRKIFIQPPAKGVAFPSTVHFQFVPGIPSAAGPIPPVTPLLMTVRPVQVRQDQKSQEWHNSPQAGERPAILEPPEVAEPPSEFRLRLEKIMAMHRDFALAAGELTR